ncbi:tenascin isoform 2 [Galdieria sulphuraria]|uniref:Tenascin isoform 2 n=1 Tax=Galdieria sulphuraria TaxID=130081 RepID=M2Y285_GALSU|nr:tenascin isoform 2 [Galdieria sulphuraria]EME30078.1 tenascin isoform 2 [Galdieria sulphuraria]|eukprot:XP_005706598.1 tenascin isoform 2 [Galdieria sulphuraria]
MKGDGPSDSSCSEHGICSVEDGTCHCFAGYLPPDCSSRNNECTQNCYGDQGACVNGSCLCFAGYRGDGCRYRRCPQNKDIQRRCLCNIGWYGNDCSKSTHNSTVYKWWIEESQRIQSQQSNTLMGGSLSALNRAVTIPNWPLPVPKPEPVSREQAVIIFNEIIDFPIFNFTKEIWNMMAANLSRKIHVPRKNIFLVHFSKYQETNSHALQHQTLLDSCIQNSSCSIEKLTLESSQQGKTSIGVAVLTKVEDIYSTRVTIREYAMESITDQLNVTSRLNGNLVILSFNNGSQQPSKGKIAFLSVVAFFVLLFSSYISIFVLRNELREEKHNKKMWLTLPAAEEDSQAVLLEELILTGTKIDWLDADTNDPIQNKHMNVHQSTNNFSTTVSKNILRRRPLNQLTTTTAQ